MKRPGMLQGIAFAFAAAVFTVPAWWLLKDSTPSMPAFRLISVLAQMGYCIHLLRVARIRVGTVSLALANLLLAAGLFWLPVSTITVVGAGAVLLSVNRSLLFHRSTLAVAADVLVALAGLGFAGYLLAETGSLPTAVWGFFLLQALFVLIPGSLSTGNDSASDTITDPFLHGRRQAEAALDRILQDSPT